MNDVGSAVEVDVNPWSQTDQVDHDDTSVIYYLKAGATITALAMAVLASAYLAYKNPRQWWLTSFTVTTVNLYLLPKVLRYGNPTLIKIALIVNLTALGSLSVGGIGAASLSFGQTIVTSVKTSQFSTATFKLFWLTAFLGYGLPRAREALEKVYHSMTDKDWHTNIVDLQEYFNARPEVGLGFLQSNLWKNFVIQLVLFKPEYVLDFCNFLNIRIPDYVWPLVSAMGSSRISLNQFQDILKNMEQTAHLAMLQGDTLPEEMKANYLKGLKTGLRLLAKEDLPQAISALLTSGSKLIPLVLSASEFLEIFIEDALDTTNEVLEHFLDLIACWEDLKARHKQLDQDMLQLEQDIKAQNIQQLTDDQEEDFSQRHQHVNQEFNELRTEIEKVYFNKRIWQDFAPLWGEETDLPFEQAGGLLVVLSDQTLLQDIEKTYRSMIEPGKNGVQTLSDRLQYITNKMLQLREEEEEKEETTSIMYLAANKGFKTKDYENLQTWLNLDSPHDLEETMANIGLATEEDLYEKNILPRTGEINKAEICQNLRHYIEQAPKADKQAHRIQSVDAMDKTAVIYTQTQKIMRVVYYFITSGLILVPILINPEGGAAGFVVGTLFFTLKRFGTTGTQTITDISYACLESFPLTRALQTLLNRRIFSITSSRRTDATQFANADFSARMRTLNWQILLSLFVIYASFRLEYPAGSFFQGIALGKELVDLF